MQKISTRSVQKLFWVCLCLFIQAGAYAQIKIGDNPMLLNPNSVLELESTNKGLLLPRLSLDSTTSAAPLTAHIAGMVVYNTASSGSGSTQVVPGLYYNDGTRWVSAGGSDSDVVTTLDSLGLGVYRYINEVGDSSFIYVLSDVINNFNTLVNNTQVDSILTQIIYNNSGNVTYNSYDSSWTYIDSLGTVQVIYFDSLVQANETVTTLINSGGGQYVYINEAGDSSAIDVMGDVINNYLTLFGDTNVANYIDSTTIQTVINNYETILGDTIVANYLDSLYGGTETVTTLTDLGAGEYVYVNEAGDSVTIHVVGDVITNFGDIINNTQVDSILTQYISNHAGNVTYNAGDSSWTYIDSAGTVQILHFDSLVQANETITTLTYDNPTSMLTYVNEAGTVVNVNLAGLAAAETITELNNLGAGQYVYINEAGDSVTIDVVGDVVTNFGDIISNTQVDSILNQYITQHAGNVTYNAGDSSWTYIDSTGTTQILHFDSLVHANETITTLTDLGGGEYVYVNEAGDSVGIHVVGDVVTNFGDIINNTQVDSILNQYISNHAGNVTYNAGDSSWTYIDSTGTVQVLNFDSLVQANETITTLTDLGGGEYVYVNEAGDSVGVHVVGDVVTNFGDIINNTQVDSILNQYISNHAGNVTYNAGDSSWTYIDSTGTVQVLHFDSLVQANETVTTLTDLGTGEYVYVNEAGDSVTIHVVGDVISNFGDIINNTQVDSILTQYISNHAGNVTYNAGDSSWTYIDSAGTVQVLHFDSLVQANETVTTLTYDNPTSTLTYINEQGTVVNVNLAGLAAAETITELNNLGAGQYVYINEAGDSVTIDVVGDVVTNFGDIINNTQVDSILNQYIENHAGNVTYNAGDSSWTYIDSSGTTQILHFDSLVQANETVTTLTDLGAGEYVYVNEAGDSVGIHVVGDVITNFGDIISNTQVDSILNQYITQHAGNVTYNSGDSSWTYIDSSGTTQILHFDSLVQANETVTTLTDLGAGEYVYVNEAGDSVGIHVVGDVITNFGDIISNTQVDSILNQYITQHAGNVTYNAGDSSWTYIDSTGTTQVLHFDSLVQANETVTTLTDLGGGEYVYVNEAGDSVTIDVVGDVITNFGDIVNNTQVDSILNQYIRENGGNVTYNAIDSSWTFIDSTGTVQVLHFDSLVQANETLTDLGLTSVTDTTGATIYTLIYTDEHGGETNLNLTDLVGDIQTLTSLTVVDSTKTLDYKDENGTVYALNITPLVQEPWYNVATNTSANTNTQDVYTMGNWVGIGYATPSGSGERLRVNGSILTASAYYADYVFEDYYNGASTLKEEYTFKTLAETESFIAQYKHLPGVTPISELEKTENGYAFNVSELSVQVLEKAEELYLHMIELNKQMELQKLRADEQQKRLDAQEAEIQALKQRLEQLEQSMPKGGKKNTNK